MVLGYGKTNYKKDSQQIKYILYNKKKELFHQCSGNKKLTTILMKFEDFIKSLILKFLKSVNKQESTDILSSLKLFCSTGKSFFLS